MKTLLVTVMISLCKTYTPSQVSNGCQDVSDFMVNCAVSSKAEIKVEKIKECEKQFEEGKRYKNSLGGQNE